MNHQFDASKLDLEKSLQSYERMDCENSLYEFFQKAWRYIDASPYTDGWPIEAVAEQKRKLGFIVYVYETYVTRKNMMSGREYQERYDTPYFCSPSSESYWSM